MTEHPDTLSLTNALASLVLENLDRADCVAMRNAAEMIDRASKAPGLDPAKAEQWGRTVALYHSALLEWPTPGAPAAPPEDWEAERAQLAAFDAATPAEEWHPEPDELPRDAPRLTFEP